MDTDRPVRHSYRRSDPRNRPTRRLTLTPLQQQLKFALGVPIPFPRPAPASVLRAAVDVYADFMEIDPLFLGYDREMCWAYMLHQLGIHTTWSWSEIPTPPSRPQRIPLEILIQLMGQRIKSGVSVTYAGRRMLVVDTFSPLGKLGEIIEELPDPKALWLADPAAIDLTR